MNATDTNITTHTGARPALSLYHANGKGTGSALTVGLRPASAEQEGALFVGIAPQERAKDNPFPRFDWEKEVVERLDFADVCAIVEVLRGESESIADGAGLFHRSPSAATAIRFRHVIEPVPGYMLEILRRWTDGEERNARFFLTSHEATGLCLAIEASIGVMCFGVPQ